MIQRRSGALFETKPDDKCRGRKDGRIVGSILCGHDGRRGCLYHVCVDEDYRRHGIGKRMVVFAMKALKEERLIKYLDRIYGK